MEVTHDTHDVTAERCRTARGPRDSRCVASAAGGPLGGNSPRPGIHRRAGRALRGRARLLRPRHADLGSRATGPRTNPEALLPQLASDAAQARSQALHTLSKIADPAIWGAITPALISDADDEVAAAAWRTAAALVPPGREAALAAALAAELGRGDRETQRRLSRAFAALGAPARAAVENGALSPNEAVSAHALATLAVMDNPDESFESAVHEATRIVALRAVPSTE